MINNSFGDIAITDVSAPSEITIGDTVELSLTITNVGTEPVFGFPFGPFGASTFIPNNLFLSADANFDGFVSQDRQIGGSTAFTSAGDLPLQPGDSATLTFDSTFTAADVGNLTGNQFLIFTNGDGEFQDVAGVSSENNVFAVPVTIKQASTIQGTIDADVLVGTLQRDNIFGLAANDTIRGRAGDDFIRGNNGSDYLFGQNGNDEIFGDNGNDRISGGAGDDSLEGNFGNDVLFGNAGIDDLFGGNGNDRLVGGSDRDNLLGGIGNDTLSGGDGDDALSGGPGFDVITSGAGFDVIFVAAGQGTDFITDFNVEEDLIEIGGISRSDLILDGNIIRTDNEILATVAGVDLESAADRIFFSNFT